MQRMSGVVRHLAYRVSGLAELRFCFLGMPGSGGEFASLVRFPGHINWQFLGSLPAAQNFVAERLGSVARLIGLGMAAKGS
jgi:hypothetical protein